MVKPALPDYECSNLSFKCWFKTNYLKKCYLPMRLLSEDFSHVIETRIGSPIQLYYIMQINSHLIWALQYSAPFLFSKISDALEMAQMFHKIKTNKHEKVLSGYSLNAEADESKYSLWACYPYPSGHSDTAGLSMDLTEGS